MKIPPDIDINNTSFPSFENFALTLQSATDSSRSLAGGQATTSGDVVEISKALVRVAGQIWRIGSIVTDPETGEPRSELSDREIRKLSNAIEAMQESIQNLGIRVIDRCNEDFHPGLPDKVVTEEPQEGISKERIIRTIRPTIMWHQTMVQRGEIDIAVPIAAKQP